MKISNVWKFFTKWHTRFSLFPYKDKTDEGLDNIYQSTKVSEKLKLIHCYRPNTNKVDDVYAEELKYFAPQESVK